MNIYEKLNAIQTELKAPKNLYNSFGKYSYRNAEGILEAVKPLLKQYGCILTLEDDAINIGDRFYIKATATLHDVEKDAKVQTSALAREDEVKKGMDGSQITGTASSYARKYALNGLFILDDTKDADTDEYHAQTTAEKTEKPKPKTQKEKAKAAYPPREEMMAVILTQWDEKKILDGYGVGKLADVTDEQVMVMYAKAVAIKQQRDALDKKES